MEKARLEELYSTTIKPRLQNQLGIKNVMEVPKITKVVLNVGVKEAVGDSKAVQSVLEMLTKISGQLPVKTLAKKSIAGFKLREGMAIGAKVTLRGRRMYEFLDRLINLSLPKVRDFQGVPSKFDGRGNYTLGLSEQLIFSEIEYDNVVKVRGMDIVFVTTAETNEEAYDLLKGFGMPFKK